jgi:hypothetical protein
MAVLGIARPAFNLSELILIKEALIDYEVRINEEYALHEITKIDYERAIRLLNNVTIKIGK